MSAKATDDPITAVRTPRGSRSRSTTPRNTASSPNATVAMLIAPTTNTQAGLSARPAPNTSGRTAGTASGTAMSHPRRVARVVSPEVRHRPSAESRTTLTTTRVVPTPASISRPAALPVPCSQGSSSQTSRASE